MVGSASCTFTAVNVMQRSEAPSKALSAAEQAFTEMQSAHSLEELEEAWKDFLHRLDRFWNKAEAHFSKSPKWAGWAGAYIVARKKDELLCYLTQARNVEEHQIEPITDFLAPALEIKPVGHHPVLIDELKFDRKGMIFRSSSPVHVSFRPGHTRLLPVTNRGRTYPAPRTHLGQSLDGKSVVELALLALRYYREFFVAAETKFYSPNAH